MHACSSLTRTCSLVQGMSDPDSSGGGKSGTSKKRKSDATPKAVKSSHSAPPKKASTGMSKKSKTAAAAAQEEAASTKSGQVAGPRVDEDVGTLVDIEDNAPISAPKPVVEKDIQRKVAKQVKREAGAEAKSKGDNVKSKQAGKAEVKTQQAAAGSGDKAANVEQKTSCVESATTGKVGGTILSGGIRFPKCAHKLRRTVENAQVGAIRGSGIDSPDAVVLVSCCCRMERLPKSRVPRRGPLDLMHSQKRPRSSG